MDISIQNELANQASNSEYYNKYGKYYEEYHAYFRNSSLMHQWERNLKQIESALPAAKDRRAVDFGCGTGLLSLMLVKMGFSVTAIDVSEVMLAELQKKLKGLPERFSKRIQYVHGGLEALVALPKSSFHVVGESSVMHHLQNYISFLQISNELLIPKGVLYLGREPLTVDEQRVHKINLPLYKFIRAIDIAFDKAQSKGKFKEVFDETIMPQYAKGGVSCQAFIEAGKELGLEILFQRIYNWHRSRQAFTLDKMLPRFLRFEKFWRTFFDLALQKG
jgi:2-polyprenyl-3-methyl-5-hydroxy-6-metoxy-1,4-benzoquinol methylase